MSHVVRNGFVFLRHANYQLQDDGTPKKLATRRTVDYGSDVALWVQRRRLGVPYPRMRPESNHAIDLLPPRCRAPQDGAESLCVKYIHTSSNKNKHPVNCVAWTPDCRRVLTASSSGEFTLWNGLTFNFETILQAHDTAVRAVAWGPAGDWLISGDHEGNVQYAQPNMNIVKVLPAHTEAIRDLCWSPGGTKFCSASDDGTCKVWHFAQASEERSLTGHGWDVKSCDWHPSKGLIVTGSKDNLVKLWDPRTSRCLTTLHGHKNTVSKVMFQRCGGSHLLATSSRDSSARIVDLRQMRDLRVLRGHERDVTTLTWHPVEPGLITTGGHDGGIAHYLLDESEPAKIDASDNLDVASGVFSQATLARPTIAIPHAHESAVWAMDYHPLGHLLVSASNDRATRFWARARPDDKDVLRDRYHVGEDEALRLGTLQPDFRTREKFEALLSNSERPMQVQQGRPEVVPRLPGLGGQIPQLPGNNVMPPPVPQGDSGGVPGIPGFGQFNHGGVPIPPPGFVNGGAIPGFGNGQMPPFPPPPPPGFDPRQQQHSGRR